MVTSRHHYRRGRLDGWCDDCHRPDRDPVHYTQVELDRGIDTDDLERGDIAAPAARTTQKHIFGAGECWCGFSTERAKAGGPNHIEAAMEPIDEQTSKCHYCNGHWDAVRDWREFVHEPTCQWLVEHLTAGMARTEGDDE